MLLCTCTYIRTDLSKATSGARKPLTTIDDNISVVKMPPTMRKRGRPKGAGLTVIGLPKRKGKTTSKPTAFVLKSEWEKTRGKLITLSVFYHSYYSLIS